LYYKFDTSAKKQHSRREIADEIKDFVDCLPDGYAKTNGNSVFTFDGDLRRYLGEKAFNP
jgi:predicted nucleic acid-binding protein